MTVIVCIDDNFGMMYNKRRQSRDKAVIEKIYEITYNRRLFIDDYSSELFDSDKVIISDNMFDEALHGDFCFVENLSLKKYKNRIDEIILFKWNRKYPSDFKFDISLDEYREVLTEEFKGNSHDKITRTVYVK